MSLTDLTELFRIMTVINIVILVFIVAACLTTKNLMYRMHGLMFNISAEQINITLYRFLGNYKMLVVIFNLVPYIALSLMR